MSDPQDPQQPQSQAVPDSIQGESVTITTSQDEPQQQQRRAPPLLSKVNRSLLERHIQYDPLSIIFTILVFAGGVAGYVTKESVVSLVSGTIFALLLAVGTYFEGARKNPYPLLVTLFALGAAMLYRYVQSYNFWPAGLIGLLTLIMFARHCYLIYLKRQSSS